MPNITAPAFVLPAATRSNQTSGVPAGMMGELVVSELLPRYATLVKAGKVQTALAIVTAPVIYSTAAGSGGPLIWNRPNSGIDCYILGLYVSNATTATSVAGGLGFALSVGQSTTPSGTTAIDASGNAYTGGAGSSCSVFRVGTVANAATTFVPLVGVTTGTTATQVTNNNVVDIGGSLIVAPGTCGFVAATATLTSGVFQIGLIWAELPV